MGGAGSGHDGATQNFGDDLRRLAGAIDSMVGELIGGETLRVEGAETGFVAEQWAASHGHAAGEQNVDGRIEPQDGNTEIAKEFGAAGLRISAAAESQDGAFFVLGGSAESGAELISFELTEGRLAVAFKELRDGDTRGLLDAIVEVDKAPSELTGQQRANRSLAGAHEASKAKNR
jgi:hypothetical protein